MFQGFSYIEVDFQICISVPLMISKNAVLLSQTVGAIDPLLPPLLPGPCLLIYSIFILYIFLWKYNCKTGQKCKIIGSYTQN